MTTDIYLQAPNGDTIPIPEGEAIAGRQKENPIFVDDQGISRQHVRFKREGRRLWITDLGSANGTQINGQTLTAHVPQPLTDGDRLDLGGRLTFAVFGAETTDRLVDDDDNDTVFFDRPAPVTPQPPPQVIPQQPQQPPHVVIHQHQAEQKTYQQTSSLAIISLLASLSIFVIPGLGLLGPVVGVITGHQARNEIAKSDGLLTGHTLATLGIIVGWFFLVIEICILIFALMWLFGFMSFLFVGAAATTLPTPLPTALTIETIDPCPRPEVCLTWPEAQAILSGVVAIQGTATHPNFDHYEIDYRPTNQTTWQSLDRFDQAVQDDLLLEWDTSTVASESYQLRLSVRDQNGNGWSEQAVVQVVVK